MTSVKNATVSYMCGLEYYERQWTRH